MSAVCSILDIVHTKQMPVQGGSHWAATIRVRTRTSRMATGTRATLLASRTTANASTIVADARRTTGAIGLQSAHPDYPTIRPHRLAVGKPQRAEQRTHRDVLLCQALLRFQTRQLSII